MQKGTSELNLALCGFRFKVPNCGQTIFCTPYVNPKASHVSSTDIFLSAIIFGNTGNNRYSGHGYSGIDRYSGTKTPDDAILFTVSGITTIVEQKFRKFRFFEAQSYKRPLC